MTNFQGEIKKIEAENKDYDRKNQNLESGICEVKKATDTVGGRGGRGKISKHFFWSIFLPN